jgi:hypothetical protein
VLGQVAILMIGTGGCVADEYDVDVFVVLPSITAPCPTLDAASVEIAIATVDGEAFAVDGGPCTSGLGGVAEASGFRTVISRVAPGFHRADIAIMAPDGGEVGRRSLPFAADRPLIAGFVRADLPGWPSATIDVLVPACVAGGELASVRVVATPVDATAAEVDDIVPCDSVEPIPHRIAVSRGPVAIAAEGRIADESVCWVAARDAFAVDDVVVELALEPTCP